MMTRSRCLLALIEGEPSGGTCSSLCLAHNQQSRRRRCLEMGVCSEWTTMTALIGPICCRRTVTCCTLFTLLPARASKANLSTSVNGRNDTSCFCLLALEGFAASLYL
jgi:hypothetical protein